MIKPIAFAQCLFYNFNVLEYRVQSSDKKRIYKVRFKGEGEHLKASCTCPAFENAGLFCRHVAALLNSSDEELKKISENSALLERAKTYVPFDERKPPPISETIKTVKDINQFIESFFEGTEYWKEYEDKEDGAEYLTIYMRKYYKNGKPYKKPTAVSYLRYEPFVYGNYDEMGAYHEELVKTGEKQMPYAVDGQAYGYLGSAGRAFLKKLNDELNMKIPDPAMP